MISGITITATVNTHSRVCTRILSVPSTSLLGEHTSPASRSVLAPAGFLLQRVSPISSQKPQDEIHDQELQRGCRQIPARPPSQAERDRTEHQTERCAAGKRKHQALRHRRCRCEKEVSQSPGETKQRDR